MENDKELAVRENESTFVVKAREQMEIAKRIIVNGKKLSDDEVRALAVYTVQTGLNISLNECYYMPGTGPIPGIAGIRRLAKESAIQEANSAKYRLVGKGYRLDFVLLEEKTNEANFNIKDGDIAYKCILISDMDEAFWLNKLFPVIEKFLSYGLDYNNAKIQAIDLIGGCPKTEYVGVVYGSESFSYNGKPEKMDRHERAKKRAEKGALKKRFALKINTDYEEPEEFVQIDIVNDNQLLLDNKEEYEDNLKDKTTDELISMLGFEEEPAKQPNHPEIPDSSLVEAAQELGGVVKTTMSLETAENMKDSKGKRYGDMTNDDLSGYSIGIGKLLAKNGLTPEKHDEYQMKLDAIGIILASRNQ